MHKAQLGDRVRVHYYQIPEQGAATENRRGQKTCEFTVGGHEVFPTLSLGVVGMTPGDRKRLTLQPKEAYGKVRRRLIRQIPRARFPKHLVLQVGKQLRIVGCRRRVTVVEIRLDSVVVDGNHPLAGEVIALEVMLIYLISLGSSPNAQSVASHLSAAP